MDLKDIGWQSVDGIHMPQYKNQWQASANTIDKCVI